MTYLSKFVEHLEGYNNMFIGDKERFAIEFELNEAKLADAQLSEWLFGRIRFWCGGEPVGQYEDDTTIRDVAIEGQRFLVNEGRRSSSELHSLSRQEIARRIYQSLYIDHGQSEEQLRLAQEQFGPLVVTPEVDVFDDWKVFLVEDERIGRLIWQQKTRDNIRECTLLRGEFDQVFKAFLSALRKSVPSMAI